MSFTSEQIAQLLQPINERRVLRANGQSHLAQQDVRAHLTRIFGFGGWEKKILSIDLVSEDTVPRGSDRVGWTVTYRCTMQLTVKDPDGNIVWQGEDGATGTGNNQPGRGDAHDLAYKNAISYALKRCAIDLGDQFGLSLYNGGQTGALVGRTLVEGSASSRSGADVQADVPQQTHDGEQETPAGVNPATGEIADPPRPTAVPPVTPPPGGDEKVKAKKAVMEEARRVGWVTGRTNKDGLPELDVPRLMREFAQGSGGELTKATTEELDTFLAFLATLPSPSEQAA